MACVLVNRVAIGVAGRDTAGASGGTVSDGDECTVVPRDDDVGLAMRTATGTLVARILCTGSSSAVGPRYSACANSTVSTMVSLMFHSWS